MKYALVILLLSACTSMPGVNADKDERAACAKSGCTVWTVWTVEELTSLGRKFFREGVKVGKGSI